MEMAMTQTMDAPTFRGLTDSQAKTVESLVSKFKEFSNFDAAMKMAWDRLDARREPHAGAWTPKMIQYLRYRWNHSD